MKYILAIDQGTTGTTAAIMDLATLNFFSHVNKEYPQIYPHPGWVEHNLNDIWETVRFTVGEVLKKNNINAKDIAAIGITNQRETTCAFDKQGHPLANAIVWQDRRTSSFCDNLKLQGQEKKIKEITGLTLDPYFSSTKMHWLLKNNDNVKKASSNNLRLGNIDSFLI